MDDVASAQPEDPSTGPNRFSTSVCFAIPVREDRLSEFYDLERPPSIVDPSWIDDDAAAVAMDTGAHGAVLQPVEAGRGASGVAVALNLVEVVANVGGALAFTAATAKAVKEVWRKLSKTKRGIISLSAGAAALLAVDSSATRVGDGMVRLIAFGAVDTDAESSYSELDVYWAVIEAVDTQVIEFYLISDKGDVSFAGRAARPVDPYRRRGN